MKRIQSHLTIAVFCVSLSLGLKLQAQKNGSKAYSFSATPTWADEFTKDGTPDPSFWSYDLGGGGWGNNEKQIYTNNPENVTVANGSLIIEAHRGEDLNAFSSARLVTKGKKDFLYGRLEVRAKLPVGRGTWPAIWTLASQHEYGDNFWPDNGEMDIMEHVGMDQNRIHANIHTRSFNHGKGTNKGNNEVIDGVSEDFHVYRLDWFPDSVRFFVDDKLLFQFDKQENYTFAEWPFDKPQHLLLNIAIGGNWGGQQGIDNSVFPQRMLVDYVRYYNLQTN